MRGTEAIGRDITCSCSISRATASLDHEKSLILRESQNSELGASEDEDSPRSFKSQRQKTQIHPDGTSAFHTAADMDEVLVKIADVSKALILISIAKGIDESVAAAVHGLSKTIAGATDSARQMVENFNRKPWAIATLQKQIGIFYALHRTKTGLKLSGHNWQGRLGLCGAAFCTRQPKPACE